MRKDLQREDFTSQAVGELIVVHQGRRWEGALWAKQTANAKAWHIWRSIVCLVFL